MNDMVNNPQHYNRHPSGIECIEVVEKMTFNLGNGCKYLWRGGLKATDPTEDYRKALWYVNRSFTHDGSWLLVDQAAMAFNTFMLEDGRARRILQRPSPWCEPVRRSIGLIFDLHGGRVVTERIEIYGQLRRCVQTAIDDAGCMGRGLQP